MNITVLISYFQVVKKQINRNVGLVFFFREENAWTKYGFNDLNNIHHIKSRHETSKNHIQSLIDLIKSGKTRIDISLSEAFKKYQKT